MFTSDVVETSLFHLILRYRDLVRLSFSFSRLPTAELTQFAAVITFFPHLNSHR